MGSWERKPFRLFWCTAQVCRYLAARDLRAFEHLPPWSSHLWRAYQWSRYYLWEFAGRYRMWRWQLIGACIGEILRRGGEVGPRLVSLTSLTEDSKRSWRSITFFSFLRTATRRSSVNRVSHYQSQRRWIGLTGSLCLLSHLLLHQACPQYP